jgi:hypothetical protein
LNRVWPTLPPAAVEWPLICEFVRETIGRFEIRLSPQRHASFVARFSRIEYVRLLI